MGLEYVGGEESEGEGLTMVCLSSRVYRYRAKAIQVTNSSLPFILDFGAYCLEKKKKNFRWALGTRGNVEASIYPDGQSLSAVV